MPATRSSSEIFWRARVSLLGSYQAAMGPSEPVAERLVCARHLSHKVPSRAFPLSAVVALRACAAIGVVRKHAAAAISYRGASSWSGANCSVSRKK
jgi:hypothetical protein